MSIPNHSIHPINIGYPILLFCLFQLWSLPHTIGQNTEPEHLFEKVELPGGITNNVNSIVQDSMGFVWFGTHGGLVKYDGYRYTTYRHNPANEKSLSHNYIEWLYLDKNNDLWIGTLNGGLNRMDIESEEFTHYQHDSENPLSVKDDRISTITQDSVGNLWVGTWESGLSRMDMKSGRFYHYQYEEDNERSLGDNAVRVVYTDSDGTIWVGCGFPWDVSTAGGLHRYDPNTDDFTRFQHDPDDDSTLVRNEVQAIFEDSQGIFWVGTVGDGIHTMDRETGTFTRYSYDSQNPQKLSRPDVSSEFLQLKQASDIRWFLEDQSGNLWIATRYAGLTKYNLSSKKFKHIQANSNSGGLSGNYVWTLYETRDGTIWIGYGSVGFGHIDKIVFPPPQISPLNNQLERHEEQINANIPLKGKLEIFYEDHYGVLWGASSGDLVKYNPQTREVKTYKYQLYEADTVGLANISELYEDQQGLLWIGNRVNALNPHLYVSRFDPQKEAFTHFQLPLVDISYEGLVYHRDYISDIKEDKNGNLWVSSNGKGLYQFDAENNTFESFRNDKLEKNERNQDFLRCIFEDSRGQIWLGAGYENGDKNTLLWFDPSTQRIQNFFSDLDHEQNVQLRSVWAISESPKGQLWIATMGSGLWGMNLDTKTLIQYNTFNSGILSDYIPSLVKDHDGHLWLGTRGGIIEFDPQSRTFLHYGEEAGLKDISFYRAYKNQAGKLHFIGSQGGVNVTTYAFYPKELKGFGKSTPPKVFMTGLRINNRPIIASSDGPLKTPIEHTPDLSLSHDQNSFSFEFAGIHYQNPAKNKHLYQLEGYDENWREADHEQPRASYTNIPPGTYTFKVRAASSEGIWSQEDTSIRIMISPPWWQTWWGRLFIVAGILGIFAFIRFLEMRKQKEKLEIERQKREAQERINAVTSKFVPNAFINSLGKKDIMEVQLGDVVAKETTVMFSDIRSYTTLSEKMTPEENFGFVIAFNRRMGPVVQQNAGFVNQYLGDSIMALFKNSPTDCLQAAIQMQQTLAIYNEERSAKGLSRIRIGIGFHTGPLMMGIIGDEKRMDAAIISDTVNTASRIESLTKHFKVNILLSEDSLEMIQKEVEESFHFRFLGKVLLKGKNEPIGMYECFDGDSPEMIEKKLESQTLFAEAMKCYLSKQFADAGTLFEEVLAKHSDDLTAQLFLEKAQNYLMHGVSEDWTGAEVMTFK